MIDTSKVCLKTVKGSDKAILCDHCGNWILDNLDKLDCEMLRSAENPWQVLF